MSIDDYQFDLTPWLSQFRLEDLRREVVAKWGEAGLGFVGGESVSGPRELAIIEQIRDEVGRDRLGRAAPTDVFLFVPGEPERRDVTKLGGLPYRPPGLPWPTTPDGRRLTFLAQFRFTESRDIVGDLPGDVLLVFVIDQYLDDEVSVVFEWYDRGLDQLVSATDVPPPVWTVPICYGLRYRMFDYPDEVAEAAISEHLHEDAQWWNVCCIEGTKIGGAPMWIQIRSVPEPLPGSFLCVIGSMSIEDSPLARPANAGSAIAQSHRHDDTLSLNLVDGGSIYIFIDDAQELHWILQFY